MGIMEVSHRSAEFGKVWNDARDNLRKLVHIPENYEIMFLQGGAILQFAGVPLNLLGEKNTATYLVTG
jgi:phosphoserine aminotransferase